jgi:AcrR family transcriptional regulator
MENRRKRRTRNDIEASINEAATGLIEERGFHDITVTAIMQKAKIEPIVFYNRYNDLGEFTDDFVKKYDYWFSDVMKKIENKNDLKTQYASILGSLFDSLQANKMMQQLLRWEVSNNNDTTQRTARLREFYTLPLVEKYKKAFEGSPVDIDAVSALIIGGIYYLILHADLSEFAGIDIRKEDGKRKIHDALDYFSNQFFSTLSPVRTEAETIARKMREKGIALDIIAECTGVKASVIEQL